MSTRSFSLISGVTLLAVGCLALIPTLYSDTYGLPLLYLDQSYGLFLDLFPMNILNKTIYIFLGLTGMACYFAKNNSSAYSKIFAKVLFWIMSTLAFLGLFPQTNTLSGYWPLFGFGIILHAFIAMLSGYFAFLNMRVSSSHQHTQGYNKI